MNLRQNNIVFLCGFFDSKKEAVSKQIVSLSSLFNKSYIYSLAEHQGFGIEIKSACKIIAVSPFTHRFLYPIFTSFINKKADLVHIFYPLAGNPFLKRIKNQNVIFTSLTGDIKIPSYHKKISHYIFECERDKENFIEKVKQDKINIDYDKLSIIFPGINLEEWKYQEPLSDFSKFKILFASMPFEYSYLEARGYNLLLEAANKLEGEFEFIVLDRLQSYDMIRKNTKRIIKANIPSNITFIREKIIDIKPFYKDTHITILPYTSLSLNKSCPLSMIESFASGRPVIVTDKVGVHNLVERCGAGLVSKPNAEDLCDKIISIKKDYFQYQVNVRKCAEEYFHLQNYLSEYSKIYNKYIK